MTICSPKVLRQKQSLATMQSPSASTSSLSTAVNHNGSKTGDELDAPMSGDANTSAADPYKRCTLKRRHHLSRPTRLPLIVPSVSSESATSGSPSNDGTGGGGLESSGRVCSRKRPVPLKPKPFLNAIAAAKGDKHSAEPVASRLCNSTTTASTTTSSTCKLSTNITTTSATLSSSVSRLSATVPSTTNRKSVANSEPVSVTVAEAATSGGGRGEGLVRKLTIRYDGAPASDSCVSAISGSTGRGPSSSVAQSARWSRSVRSAAAAADDDTDGDDDNDGDCSASVSLVAAAAAKRDGHNSGTSSVARCTSASTSTFYISTSTTATNSTSTSTAAAAAVSSSCGNDTNNNVTGGAVETQSGRVAASLSITELKQMIRHLPLPAGAPPAKPPRTFTHSTDTINNNSGGGSVADSEGSSGGGVRRGKLNNFVSSLARHVNRSGMTQKPTAVNTDGDGGSATAAAAAKCPVGRKVGQHVGHAQVGSGTADHGRITSLPDGDQLDAEVLSRAKDPRLCRSVMLQRRAASKGMSNRPAVRHSAGRAGFGFSDLLGLCVKSPAGYASLINLTDSAIEHVYDEPCTDCGSCGAGKWSHMCSKRSAVDRQRDFDVTDVAVAAAAAPEKVVQPYAVSALIGADLTPGTPQTNEAAHCTPSQALFCGRSFGQSGRSLEDCGRSQEDCGWSEAMNQQENPVGVGGGGWSKLNDSVNRSSLSACSTANEPEKSATLLRRNRAFIRRQRPLRRDGDSSHEPVTAPTPVTTITSTTAAAPAAAPPPAAAASAAKKSDASNGSSSNTASAAVAPPPRPPQPVAAARRRLKTAAAAGAEALWSPSLSTLQRSRHVDLVQSKMLLRRPSADTAQVGGVFSALAVVTAAAAPPASDQAGSPRVVSCHPSTAEIPDMLAQLCFPYRHHCRHHCHTVSAAADGDCCCDGGAGRQQQQQQEEEPACYCVTLVDRHNTLVYAVCRPVVQAERDLPPLLYCLLARRPLPSLLANVLSVVIELSASSSAGSLDQIMSQLTSQPPPPLGHKLLLTLPKPSATLSSGTTSKSAISLKSRPTATSSSTLSTSSSALSSTARSPNDRQAEAECVVVRARDWTTTAACANIVWLARRVGVNVFVRLFASTLLERTIILSSRHHGYLHRGVSALLAAICPFVWQHCVVPVLPSSLAARVLDSSPCLVGVAADCRLITESLGTHHCLCVDLDEGGVVSAVGDESTILPASVQSALGRLLTQQCDTADDAVFSHRRGHHSPRSHFQQALAATLAPLFGDNFSRFCHKSLSEIRTMLESDGLPDDVHQFLY